VTKKGTRTQNGHASSPSYNGPIMGASYICSDRKARDLWLDRRIVLLDKGPEASELWRSYSLES
jgi:hypothetical protein